MGFDMVVNDVAGVDALSTVFSTSIFGMSALLNAMREAGSIDDDTKVPTCPEIAKAYKNDHDKIEEVLRPWRATKSPYENKIPAFKFYTNDGWIVSPHECAVIAEGLKKFTLIQEHIANSKEYAAYSCDAAVAINYGFMDFKVIKILKEFREFCLMAEQHGGFRVR